MFMTTLLKLGGAVCTLPETLDQLAHAWNHRTDHAESWIIVHGGGPQLDQALLAIEGPPVKVDGLRVTSTKGADVVLAVLGQVGQSMAEGLLHRGLPVHHVSALERRLEAVIKNGPLPLGRVGSATRFDASGLPGGILIVTPVGFDSEGPLNVNADEAALAVARAFQANRLMLATDVPFVRDGAGASLVAIDLEGAETLLSSGAVQGGMIPKLRTAMKALESGFSEAIIGDLSAMWTDSGTRITANSRQQAVIA